MSVTPTNNTRLHDTSLQTNEIAQRASPKSGLSSVGNTLSSGSAGSNGPGKIFTAIFQPLIARFESLKEFIASLFGMGKMRMSADEARFGFIKNHLNKKIDNAKYQECLDKFFHIRTPVTKLEAFKWIQKSPHASERAVKAFFGQLPVDMQNHIKRHVWEANGKNDGGLGIHYGNYIVNWFPKHDYVSLAIDKCLIEAREP